MDFERVYSYLIGCSWFFLAGWLLTLVVASVVAFQTDLQPAGSRPAATSSRLH